MCGGNKFNYTALVRQIRKLCLAQPARACYYKGDLGHAPQKITCSEIDFEGISNILYIGVILTLTVHILALAICSFIIISSSVATVLTQTTR